MKMDSTSEIAAAHEAAVQLIPWLVNGTLCGAEAARLRAHLVSCEQCRTDFEVEERLYAAIRSDGPLVFAGEPSFQKLAARIEASDFAAPPATSTTAEWSTTVTQLRGASGAGHPQGHEQRCATQRGTPRRRARQTVWRASAAVRWLSAAVVIEALSLGLGAWLWQSAGVSRERAYPLQAMSRESTAPYRTLTRAAIRYGAGALVRVVFRSDLSLGALQKLLEGIGAHIVDGPTEAHVYTLGFAMPVATGALDARIAALRADPHVLFAEPAGDRPP